MKLKTIRDCGKLGIEFSNVDARGARVARELLRTVIGNVVRRSTVFHDALEECDEYDHAFFYGEKPFHSILCPSIADMEGATFLMEHPTERKPHGKEKTRGNVDYWISYRGYTFLVELKHAYFRYNSRGKITDISGKYDEACSQLASIKRKACKYLSVNEALLKIPLEVIVFYEKTEKELPGDFRTDKLNLPKRFRRLLKELTSTQKPNMLALWILNERLIQPTLAENGDLEIYPAVAFIANISEAVE